MRPPQEGTQAGRTWTGAGPKGSLLRHWWLGGDISRKALSCCLPPPPPASGDWGQGAIGGWAAIV